MTKSTRDMGKRRRGNRGQSILEYLVIATVIVAAIIIGRNIIQGEMATLYTNAGGKVTQAASALGSLVIEQ